MHDEEIRLPDVCCYWDKGCLSFRPPGFSPGPESLCYPT